MSFYDKHENIKVIGLTELYGTQNPTRLLSWYYETIQYSRSPYIRQIQFPINPSTYEVILCNFWKRHHLYGCFKG